MVRLDEILVEANLASSKTVARNLIKGGAIAIQDHKVTDPYAKFGLQGSSVIVFEFDEYLNVGNLILNA